MSTVPPAPAPGARDPRSVVRGLAIVEPFVGDRIVDRPHLGCANLIAVCRAAGVPARLVAGQTRYLKAMFTEDVAEAWDLLMSCPDDAVASLQLTAFRDGLRRRGLDELSEELPALYAYVLGGNDPRAALDGAATERLDSYHTAFCRLYAHVLRNDPDTRVSLVERYVAEILADEPRFVGFSLQSGFDPLTRAVRRRLRAETDATLIVGGPLTPFLPARGYATLFERECLDRLVVGEAESSLPALLQALTDGRSWDVPNVYRLEGGQVRGEPGPPPDDLDALPFPDYDQVDLDAYPLPMPVLAVQSARGCTWHRCAFCELHAPFGGRFRTFSVDRFVETLAYLRDRHGVRHFTIADLEVPPARARRIAEAILEAGLDVRLDMCARLGRGFDDDMLMALLHRAGLRAVEWGLESGCQRVLDLMDKGTKVPVMRRVLRKAAAQGVANLCFVMVGFPGERGEEAGETFDFLHGVRDAIARADVGLFELRVDSRVGQDPARWGVARSPHRGFSVDSGMTPAEAEALERRLRGKLRLSPQEWSSGELSCLPPSSLSRLLHFVFQSQGMVPAAGVAARREQGELGGLAIIVAGRLSHERGHRLYHPVAVRESTLLNVMHPASPQPVDDVVADALFAADGSLGLDEICLDGAESEVCRAALVDLLETGRAVAFTELWKRL